MLIQERARIWNDYQVDVPEGSSGRWTVKRFMIEPGNIHRTIDAMHGRDPGHGEFTSLMRDGRVIMSDTAAEVRDHYEVFRRLRQLSAKRVLIHGLGLGMVVKYALAQPHVEHVDVVEIDSDVIALVGPFYTDPRLTVHLGDALTYKWPAGFQWEVVWHDIFDDLCTDNLPVMQTLHRKFGRRAGWQGSWGRELCERQDAVDRKNERWGAMARAVRESRERRGNDSG